MAIFRPPFCTEKKNGIFEVNSGVVKQNSKHYADFTFLLQKKHPKMNNFFRKKNKIQKLKIKILFEMGGGWVVQS